MTVVNAGGSVSYTIIVRNFGPDAANGATVTDNVPTALTNVTWTCSADPGLDCGAASGAGSINTTVNLANNGRATFTVNATVAANATGSLETPRPWQCRRVWLIRTRTTTARRIRTRYALARPNRPLLDTFDRTDANNLGANWGQAGTGTNVAIHVNSNRRLRTRRARRSGSPALAQAGRVLHDRQYNLERRQPDPESHRRPCGGTGELHPRAVSDGRWRPGGGCDDDDCRTKLYDARHTDGSDFRIGRHADRGGQRQRSVDVWQNTTYLGRARR